MPLIPVGDNIGQQNAGLDISQHSASPESDEQTKHQQKGQRNEIDRTNYHETPLAVSNKQIG
jgi:hypothetical protein